MKAKMNLDSKLNIYLSQTSSQKSKYHKPEFQPPRIGYLRKTKLGEIWVVDWEYNCGYLHGNQELNRIESIHEFLDPKLGVFNPSIATVIDTETTGLAGGAGTYAFIIGAGFWQDDKFIVRQYMMRDFNEEPAQLTALAEDYTGSAITYNGKCFDLPLLTNRYRLHRFETLFENPQHLDMLFPSRRIWKHSLPGFKLTQMEENVLGYARDGDIPSHLIPSIFFDYLQTRNEELLYPILHHNRDDILSLYILTCVASQKVNDCFEAGSNDDSILLSLAETCFNQRNYESVNTLIEKIKYKFVSKKIAKQALLITALTNKKIGNWDKAVEAFWGMYNIEPEIYSSVELAKLYEHKIKDPARALEIVQKATALLELFSYTGGAIRKNQAELLHRQNRLHSKVSRLLHK